MSACEWVSIIVWTVFKKVSSCYVEECFGRKSNWQEEIDVDMNGLLKDFGDRAKKRYRKIVSHG
jgi:hypothetical protein